MNERAMGAPHAAVRKRISFGGIARAIRPACVLAQAALFAGAIAGCDEPRAPMPYAGVEDGGAPWIELSFDSSVRVPIGTTTGYAATIGRTGGLEGAVTVGAHGLPSGVHLETITVADGESTAFFFLRVDANAVLGGPFPITLVARSVERPDVFAELPVDLYVAGPLGADEVTFAPEGLGVAPRP